MSIKKLFSISVLAFLFIGRLRFCYSDEHDATVTTSSGTYSTSAEVENGEITQVHWPNGGSMNLTGADVEDGEATGTNSRGETVNVTLDDYDEDEEANE